MVIKSSKIKMWSKLGQRGAFFGIALPEEVKEHPEVKLLTADLSLLSSMDRFITAYPDQFLNVGIAEQNMIGIAAGLSMEGYNVFATTYASFIAVRSLEHVRQHLSHLKCNVKIIGSSAGVIAAKSGVSHWATEDLAFIRALPNLQVFSPADALEAMKMAEYAVQTEGPMYIRLSGGLNCPIIYHEDYDWQPGKAVCLKEGKDTAILATGLMVAEALKAAEILEEQGISAAVYDFHTIKPLDRETLDRVFENFPLIITAEEHNIIGGFGSAVAEYKATKTKAPRQVFIGFPDSFGEAGSQRFIWQQMGMTGEQMVERVKQELD